MDLQTLYLVIWVKGIGIICKSVIMIICPIQTSLKKYLDFQNRFDKLAN